MYDIRPESAEVKMIAAHVTSMSKIEDVEKRIGLDRPEKFLYEMSQLPQFDERVACFIFQDTFKGNALMNYYFLNITHEKFLVIFLRLSEIYLAIKNFITFLETF